MGQSKPFQKVPMSKSASGATGGRCPICRSATEHAYRPFCSSRCADIDLGKWLTGGYVMPSEESSDSEDDGTDAQASKTARTPQRTADDEDD
jgi:uncharacterized protein